MRALLLAVLLPLAAKPALSASPGPPPGSPVPAVTAVDAPAQKRPRKSRSYRPRKPRSYTPRRYSGGAPRAGSTGGYQQGPKGGCYTYSKAGKKRYVDRSRCRR